MSSGYLVPQSVYGSEPDLEPWQVQCRHHGTQIGRLTDREHFGEASNAGCCEMCLKLDFVMCDKHWVQIKTTDGGCYECFKEQHDPAGPAVAASASPPRTPEPGPLVDFSFPRVDAGQGVLDAPVRPGPETFGGLADSNGGWARPGELPRGGGDGAGNHPAGSTRQAVPIGPAPATAATQEPDVITKFRSLAAQGLLRGLAATAAQDDTPQGGA